MKKWERQIYLIGLASLDDKSLAAVIGKSTSTKKVRDKAIERAKFDRTKITENVT